MANFTPTSKITAKVANSNYASEYFNTFELRQEVKVLSELKIASDGYSLFDDTLVFEKNETRVIFQKYPKNITLEDVKAKLEQLYKEGKNPCIYKVIANHPIITDKELKNIELDYNTPDSIEKHQRVKFVTENGLEDGLDVNGRLQYKKLYLSADFHDDEDWRQTEEDEARNPVENTRKWLSITHSASSSETNSLPF